MDALSVESKQFQHSNVYLAIYYLVLVEWTQSRYYKSSLGSSLNKLTSLRPMFLPYESQIYRSLQTKRLVTLVINGFMSLQSKSSTNNDFNIAMETLNKAYAFYMTRNSIQPNLQRELATSYNNLLLTHFWRTVRNRRVSI